MGDAFEPRRVVRGWGIGCLVLACVCAVLYFVAGAFHATPVMLFLKPIPALSGAAFLFVVAAVCERAGALGEAPDGRAPSRFVVLAGVAFVLYAVGDFLLCFRTRTSYVPLAVGMVFFFVGHCCMVLSCYFFGSPSSASATASAREEDQSSDADTRSLWARLRRVPRVVGAAALAAGEVVAIVVTVPVLHAHNPAFSPWMLVSGAAYLLVYPVLAYYAVRALPRGAARATLCTGTAVYLASDLLLGGCLVLGTFPLAGALVMLSYWAALALFYAAVLLSVQHRVTTVRVPLLPHPSATAVFM